LGEISLGEDSRRQFKRTLSGPDQAAAELTAFLNSGGGRLYIGVDDRGAVTGLDSAEIPGLNQLIANAATGGVRPAAAVRTLTERVDGKIVMIVEVPDGLNKPYCDNEGRFWVKLGSDKRKVTSPEELQRLFQAGRKLHADESPVPESGIEDIDLGAFDAFHQKKFGRPLSDAELPLGKMLDALGLAKKGALTLAGLLLFGRNVQKFQPLFEIQAVAFSGGNISDDSFTDRAVCGGTLAGQYRQALSFLLRNLIRRPVPGGGFNQPGEPEIPEQTLAELLVNALVHRDYFIGASVKLFVFPDRIEIQSPGVLPNSLSVENILMGVSVPRNPLIHSHAQFILPYSGLGSGIPRALKHYPGISFVNDSAANRFIVKITRAN
jgi:predicted HTH transcriptional regulator